MDYRTKNRLLYRFKLRCVKLLNLILMTAGFAFVWNNFLKDDVYVPFFYKGNIFVIALFFFIYYMYGRTYEAFLISYNRISEMIYSQMLALLVTDVIMYVISWLLIRFLPSFLPFAILLGIQLIVSILWSTLSHVWYFHKYSAKKTVVIWDMRQGLEELVASYGLEKKFNVCADYRVDKCIKNLAVLNETETVFLAGIHSHDRNIIIKYCVEHHISVFVIPRVGDVLMSGAKRMHLFHLPILRLERYDPNPEFVVIKRAFDIIVSALAIVLSSPIAIVTAVAIKATDGGPVFYKQCRLTKDGKMFNVLKFRSMRIDAEKDGVARLSTGENDNRITPVGKVIRKYRIDELPQFINIFMGDMSFVGPRPERPEIAEEYEKDLPEFRLRLQAKCGLTGYAQVYGKYNTIPYDKLQMDLMYISNPSLMQDLGIMFATVKILFASESTEGVQEGQTTAMNNKVKEK